MDDPLEWLLVTNVPVLDLGDAVERIRWYRLRWHIEVFHKVLKSGCTIEDCRLDTAEELIRYVTLKSVIAWRLVWMVQVNRVQPELACSVVLASQEWQALYAAIHRTASLPATEPTVAVDGHAWRVFRPEVRWRAWRHGTVERLAASSRSRHDVGGHAWQTVRITVPWRGGGRARWQRSSGRILRRRVPRSGA